MRFLLLDSVFSFKNSYAMCSITRKVQVLPGPMYLKGYYILPQTPCLAYEYMGTDVKYIVTYMIFIVTA